MIAKLTIVVLGMVTLPFVAGMIGHQGSGGPRLLQEETTQAFGSNSQEETAESAEGFELTSSAPSRFQSWGLNSQQRKVDQEIKVAAKTLRQAKSDGERNEARDRLFTLLSKDYDERLTGYDQYLEALESKIAQMRDRLQKRREAKSEMIKLRIKVLEAEADDLGWPERMSGRSLFDSSDPIGGRAGSLPRLK